MAIKKTTFEQSGPLPDYNFKSSIDYYNGTFYVKYTFVSSSNPEKVISVNLKK